MICTGRIDKAGWEAWRCFCKVDVLVAQSKFPHVEVGETVRAGH